MDSIYFIHAIYFSFQKALHKTVNLSDKIGYIYWFFVLLTTSFALMTGIYVTMNNKRAMDTICSKTLQQYDEYFIENKLTYPMLLDNNVEPYKRIVAMENELKYMNVVIFDVFSMLVRVAVDESFFFCTFKIAENKKKLSASGSIIPF